MSCSKLHPACDSDFSSAASLGLCVVVCLFHTHLPLNITPIHLIRLQHPTAPLTSPNTTVTWPCLHFCKCEAISRFFGKSYNFPNNCYVIYIFLKSDFYLNRLYFLILFASRITFGSNSEVWGQGWVLLLPRWLWMFFQKCQPVRVANTNDQVALLQMASHCHKKENSFCHDGLHSAATVITPKNKQPVWKKNNRSVRVSSLSRSVLYCCVKQK